MSILITGSNGFIGKTLTKQLVARGAIVRAAVRGVVNPITEFQAPCLGGQADWRSALDGVSVVVHTAARAHILHEKSVDPLSVFREINVAGTLTLAKQAAEMNVKRFIFLSSIGVNGVESIVPFRASDSTNPIDFYAVSKFEAEISLMEIAQSTDMEVVIIRPPLVYGPNAPGNFGKLANAVKRGLVLPLGSVTHNQRSLIGLDNLVDLILTCISHPAAANQTFLAGDGEDVSTTALLRKMAFAMNVPSRLLPVPLSFLEITANIVGKRALLRRLCGTLQVDIGKTRSLLDWNPPLTLDQGLKKAVEDMKP